MLIAMKPVGRSPPPEPSRPLRLTEGHRPRSTIQIDPKFLVEIVQTLKLVGIDVVGSKEGDGVVSLIIQGDIVPEAPQVTISWETVIGSIYAQITVRCEVVS